LGTVAVVAHYYKTRHDTTEFICEGVMDSAKKEAAAWKIVASSACGHAEKGVIAVYELDNT
jgi:hypothetical protein